MANGFNDVEILPQPSTKTTSPQEKTTSGNPSPNKCQRMKNEKNETIADATQKIENKENKFVRSQIVYLTLLCFCQFCLGACASLQGPFFPRLAEKKGASPTVYGFILGSFELASLVTAPLFGKLVVSTAPKFLIVCGSFVAGSCNVLYSFLDRSPPGNPFIILAFACNIMEGFGNAAIMTSSYTAIPTAFPGRVTTAFSLFETFFGIGIICGPTFGGVFYELQGYPLPYQVMGSLLLLFALISFIFLPSTESETKGSGDMWKFLSNFEVILNALSVITGMMYVRLFTTSLEAYLRPFHLRPSILGIVFVIPGVVYAVCTPLWGFLCDKGVTPNVIGISGYVMQCVSIIFIGPAPFIPMEPQLWLIIVSLVLAGLGISAKMASSFASCLQGSLKRGLPNDLATFGMVSALIATSISVGAFAGPSLGGLLWDEVGFRIGTMVYLGFDVLVLLLFMLYTFWERRQTRGSQEVEIPMQPVIKDSS